MDYEILSVCKKSAEQEFSPTGDAPYLHDHEYTFPAAQEKTASSLSHRMSLLEQFSFRNLSFQFDALNAVVGILKSLRTEAYPVGSIWSVPFGDSRAAKFETDHRLCLY